MKNKAGKTTRKYNFQTSPLFSPPPFPAPYLERKILLYSKTSKNSKILAEQLLKFEFCENPLLFLFLRIVPVFVHVYSHAEAEQLSAMPRPHREWPHMPAVRTTTVSPLRCFFDRVYDFRLLLCALYCCPRNIRTIWAIVW